MKDPLPASAFDLKLAEPIELPAPSWLTGARTGSGFAATGGSARAIAVGAGRLGARG
jgi:hypothetical protein